MGSSPKVEAPRVDARETTRESIAAQLESLPDVVAAQREFAPQLTQIDLEQLQKALPVLSELGRSLSAADIEFQREQFPETAAAQEQLAGVFGGADLAAERTQAQTSIDDALDEFLSGADPLTSEQRRQFRDDIRTAQIARGQERFGFSASAETRGLEDLRQQQRTANLNARLAGIQARSNLTSQGINTALSTTGRVPVAGGQQINFQPQGQLLNTPTVGQFLSAAQGNQQAALQAAQFNAQQPNPLGSILGSAAGSFTGSAGVFGAAKLFGR